MAKPIVTTAAASMYSVINWRMRLRGRSLIVRTAWQGSSRRSDPGRAAANGSERTVGFERRGQGVDIARAAGEFTETRSGRQDDTIEG
jgi:hypothetical protein